MSWHEIDCIKCDKNNWVHCPDADPNDPSGYDYDGFECYSCKTEQLWPGTPEHIKLDTNHHFITEGLKSPV